MKILKIKVMLVVRLKEEERKYNLYVEKDSLDEKVKGVGFSGGAFCDIPHPHVKFNKSMFGFSRCKD